MKFIIYLLFLGCALTKENFSAQNGRRALLDLRNILSEVSSVPIVRSCLDFSLFRNITCISDNFMMNCPQHRMTAQLSGLLHLRHIGNNFLAGCSFDVLEIINLPVLTHIGDNFLAGCSINELNLKNIPRVNITNLRLELRHLGGIGEGFLVNCGSFKEVTLRFRSEIQEIPDNFLTRCSNLICLELPSLQPNAVIGNNFLHECTLLTSLNLRSFSYVTRLGNDFLSGCTALKNIDFFPLQHVTQIGTGFLSCCSSLQDVNFSGMTLQSIPNDFLVRCTALRSVILPTLKPNAVIGNNFLSNSNLLTFLDLMPLRRATQLGINFLSHCSHLKSVDCSGMTLHGIPDNFLVRCPSLRSVRLPTLQPNAVIGNNFLSNSNLLNFLDLQPLQHATQLGNNFLSHCSHLKRVDCSGMTLQNIPNGFLHKCKYLKYINLPKLQPNARIGDNFMKNCRSLKQINLDPFYQANSIGNNFLLNCLSLLFLDLCPLNNVSIIGIGFLSMNIKDQKCIKDPKCINVLMPLSYSMLPHDKVDFYYTPLLQALDHNDILSERIKLTARFNPQGFFTLFFDKILSLTAFDMFISLGKGGFFHQYRFKAIDLFHLEFIKKIDDSFLSDCNKLQSIEI